MSKFGPRLPNFIVIGAMKAGTSSLNQYLAAHPQITVPSVKEVHFFNLYWNRGIDWYSNFFIGDGEVCGESTPEYSKYPIVPNVPERMNSILPNIKLIYLLRNPFERIKSHYMHMRIHGYEARSFDVAIRSNNFVNQYVCASCYYYQLLEYLNFFRMENIFIQPSDDLLKYRIPSLQNIFSFLGVDVNLDSDVFFQKFNETRNKHLPTKTGRIILYTYKTIANKMFKHRSSQWIFFEKITKYRIVKKIGMKFTREISQIEISPEISEELNNIFYKDLTGLERLTGIEINL